MKRCQACRGLTFRYVPSRQGPYQVLEPRCSVCGGLGWEREELREQPSTVPNEIDGIACKSAGSCAVNNTTPNGPQG